MIKLFAGLTFAALAIISVSFEAHAGSYALDDKGDLFVVDAFGGMIFKYTPDGKKSTFASGLKPHGGYEVACDHAGNVFVQATSLYQLSGDEWKALGSPDDKISEILQEAIAAQLKRKGLSEENLSRQKESLRSVWSTPKVIN